MCVLKCETEDETYLFKYFYKGNKYRIVVTMKLKFVFFFFRLLRSTFHSFNDSLIHLVGNTRQFYWSTTGDILSCETYGDNNDYKNMASTYTGHSVTAYSCPIVSWLPWSRSASLDHHPPHRDLVFLPHRPPPSLHSAARTWSPATLL